MTVSHEESLPPGPRPNQVEVVPTPQTAKAEVQGDSYPPHSCSEWGNEPAAETALGHRDPHPPPAARGRSPAPWGAVALRRSGRRPLSSRWGQGREGAAAAPGSVEAPVPGGESTASTNGLRGRCGAGSLPPAAATPGPTALSPPRPALGYRPPPELEAAGSSSGAGRRCTHLGSEGRRADSAAPARSLFSQTPH